MTTTGTVAHISTDPRGVSIQRPGDPPPPLVAFSPLTDDQWALLVAAWGSGKTVTVEGTAPNATKVSA